MPPKTCPPCTGNCNQGDECPHRTMPPVPPVSMEELEDSAAGEILRWLVGYPLAFVAAGAAVAWFGRVLTWW